MQQTHAIAHRNSSDNIAATGVANPLPVNFISPATAANKATFVRGFKAPASIGTPEALAAAGTYVQKVTIFAIRASRTTNTSSVWVDAIATNNAQSIELLPGSAGNPMGAFVSFEAPPGKVIDVADIYVDAATVTDGVFFLGML